MGLRGKATATSVPRTTPSVAVAARAVAMNGLWDDSVNQTPPNPAVSADRATAATVAGRGSVT
jgi:hypothetical protein